MSKPTPNPVLPASRTGPSTTPRRSRLIRAARSLRLAGAVLHFSSQFFPLGDHGELLADLAARARAARDHGV